MDQLRARLRLLGPAPGPEHPNVEVLTPAAARGLHPPWLSRFSAATLMRHIETYPGMAMWIPETGEYVVAELWRNRAEIANLIEVTARRGRAHLVRSLLNHLAARGCDLALLSSEAWQDNTRFYMDLGFRRIETIVFFELALRREGVSASSAPFRPTIAGKLPRLQYSEVLPSSDLDLLMRLDHDSFPWLWWNSREEFQHYLQLPGVHAYVARDGDEPVGYASFTVYQGWAHLDRLAVITGRQGRKYGAAQLAYTLQFMSEAGANSVALSTQADNVPSHRLYKGFGFRQTSETMSFYGVDLK